MKLSITITLHQIYIVVVHFQFRFKFLFYDIIQLNDRNMKKIFFCFSIDFIFIQFK